MKTKTTYGNTIHADDTITRTIIYYFTDRKKFQSFWENRESLTYHSNGSWIAKIRELRIEVKDYVKSEMYFTFIDGDEEE